MIRLSRTVYVTGHELRLGRLVLERDPHYRVATVLWFKNPGPNWVKSCNYGPIPRKTKEMMKVSNAAMDRYDKFLRDGIPDSVTWPKPGWPPEGIPSADEVALRMLAAFTQRLNELGKQEGVVSDHVYEPGQFYMRRLIAAYETYYWVVVLEVYDGDDGGSSVLTGYWWIPSRSLQDQDSELRYMVQEFDTTLSVIVGDEYFSPNTQ